MSESRGDGRSASPYGPHRWHRRLDVAMSVALVGSAALLPASTVDGSARTAGVFTVPPPFSGPISGREPRHVVSPGVRAPQVLALRRRAARVKRLVLTISGTLLVGRQTTLTVHLNGTHGHPVRNVAVTVDARAVGIATILRGTTDRFGVATFAGVRPLHAGNIIVTTEKHGYQMLTRVVAVGPARPQPPPTGSTETRPVLAFYYTWYRQSDWCRCQMSDLPVSRYDSSDDQTIDRQIAQAAQAGITGFITSWPGPRTTQDATLAKLFAHAASYERNTGTHFVSSIYFESDVDGIRNHLRGALHHVITHYTTDPHYFRWHGKPVIFIWDPLGNGRTLSTWAALRQHLDPGHHLIWSAEGTDTSLLSVFDGLHLFSAGYWGLLNGTMASVDQNFRSRINAYNAAHGTQKIWAAGVEPGYDDTRVPGRTGAYTVPRNKGATYRTSWAAAMSSGPDWITITTFNEWFEGAMIEPSVSYGSLYLNLTKQYSQQWRSMR